MNTALVAGASGIIGRALLEQIARTDGWSARALSRRARPGGASHIAADLSDADATRRALAQAADTTHLFYAAYSIGGGFDGEDRVNAAMLRNLLDGLAAVGAPLRRVVLYQGAKVYGVHLGPVASPFYEDDNPRPIGPNFDFTQDDELRRRAEAGGPDFAILRPDVVLGDADGHAQGHVMNIATVIGAYAALSKADGAAFRFPGTADTYDRVLAQFTDARALARASLWAATADAASGQAFNYVHPPFRWRRVWERVAARFGLATGPATAFSLAGHMPLLEPVWNRIATGLVQPDYASAVGWGFGDFVFGSSFDVVSDMTKIRLAGFTEDADPVAALIGAIERQIAARTLPPI